MPITYSYKVGLKHQIVEALREVFNDPNFPDARYRGIYVGLEYPYLQEQLKHGAIFVTYEEGLIQNVGVGHVDEAEDQYGNNALARHFRFEGRISFNILALDPVDRDNISAILLNLLAFAPVMPEFSGFYDKIGDAQYVQISLMRDQITPGGEQVGNTPWDTEDERMYGNQYSVALVGEFFSDPDSGDLIEIRQVNLYPFTPGQPIPW